MGCTRKLACKLAGVSESQFYLWLQTGRAAIDRDSTEKEDKKFIDFAGEIERAEGISAMRALSRVQACIDGDDDRVALEAAKFMLERRHGYSKEEKAPVEITINQDSLDVPALIEEVRVQQERLKPIALPVIDLDEE